MDDFENFGYSNVVWETEASSPKPAGGGSRRSNTANTHTTSGSASGLDDITAIIASAGHPGQPFADVNDDDDDDDDGHLVLHDDYTHPPSSSPPPPNNNNASTAHQPRSTQHGDASFSSTNATFATSHLSSGSGSGSSGSASAATVIHPQPTSTPTSPTAESATHKPNNPRPTSAASPATTPFDPTTLTSFHTLVHRRSPYEVSVTDPHKHGEGFKEAHVSYLITTRDVLHQNATHSVRRRFTDFVWLHDTLVVEYPAVIVCPLPGKHRLEYITGDRFSAEFVDRRRVSLQRFLSRITRHPLLQKSSSLRRFLTAVDWNLAEIKSSSANEASATGSGGPSTVDRKLAATATASAPSDSALMDSLLPTALSSGAKPKRPNPKFTGLREATETLESQLAAVDKLHAKLVKRHVDLEHDFLDLGAGITKLGALEGASPQADMVGTLTKVGGLWYDLARVRGEATRREDVDLAAHLRDALAMCASVKLALRRRDEKQAEREQLEAAVYAHRCELAKVTGGPVPLPPAGLDAGGGFGAHTASVSALGGAGASAGGVGVGGGAVVASVGNFIKEKYDEIKGVDHERARHERAAKLEAKIAKLSVQSEAARDVDELFSAEVAREVDYATASRAGDFREMLSEVVDSQVEYFDRSVKMWEGMVRALEELDIVDD
ncbi:hypothetical protein BCR44DRAFT_1438670, partial [Catenaria anguillulae PL171]